MTQSLKLVNPIHAISRYVGQHRNDEMNSRSYILMWLAGEFPNYDGEQLDVLADCIIAAGLGRPEEQRGTIFVTARRG